MTKLSSSSHLLRWREPRESPSIAPQLRCTQRSLRQHSASFSRSPSSPIDAAGPGGAFAAACGLNAAAAAAAAPAKADTISREPCLFCCCGGRGEERHHEMQRRQRQLPRQQQPVGQQETDFRAVPQAAKDQ